MRLIDADALLEFAKNRYYKTIIPSDIVAFPTIDAVEVVHGRWITHNKGQNNWCECSECNTVGSPFWKRCPVCEAKMDGEDNGRI